MDQNSLLSFLKDRFCINDYQEQQLIQLIHLTLVANEKMNLTAIKNVDEFCEKMIYDSALPFVDFKLDNLSVLDFGTGAGFPGLVLAILFPKSDFLLLDSTSKKIKHIKDVSIKIGLKNVKTIACRVEDFAHLHIEEFDVVVGRAVCELNIFVEISSALVKKDGFLIAMKGSKAFEELERCGKGIKKLGLDLYNTKIDTYIAGDQRISFYFQKVKSTPKKYPREYKTILNAPLK